METNKFIKVLRRMTLLLCGITIFLTFTVFTILQKQHFDSLALLRGQLSQLNSDYIIYLNSSSFTIDQQFVLVLVAEVVVFFVFYLIIASNAKRMQKSVNLLIKQMTEDEVVDISLDGEFAQLQEKIYELKKDNVFLKEENAKAVTTMSDYIENISHQLKTPIASIQLNEEIIDSEINHPLLIKNKNSFNRLNNLLDELLKLTRIDHDRIQFDLQQTSVEELMKRVHMMTNDLLNHTSLTIQTCDTQFFCDEEWLAEAIYNIIKNDVEEGVEHISIECIQNRERLHIFIKDNGKGFNEEDLPHIFERFYRSKDKKVQGMGIGLSLTKEIVEKQHGFINAYNDQGAVFDLSFPYLDIKEKVIES